MSTAVVAYESASLTDRMKYAQTLAAAGDLIPKGLWSQPTNVNGSLVPAAPSPGKVLLVMETGAMLGLHPMAAMQSIDVVEGRATLSAKLMSGLIRKAGHRLTITKTGSIPAGDYSVTVVGTRADTGEEFTSTWDMERAIRAGLVDSYRPGAGGKWEVRARTKNGQPKPWEAYAEVMPVNRGISEVSREGFSDVLFGLYGTEEMTDGGFPIADPDPEPTEDWLSLIAGADSTAALEAIGARLAEKGEGTDKIRAAYRARSAVLAAESNIEDAEIVDEENPAEDVPPAPSPSTEPSAGPAPDDDYEAVAEAEYAAAVARGEVQP